MTKYDLRDFIFQERLIPSEVCDEIINNIKDKDWKKHVWYDSSKDLRHSFDDAELEILNDEESLKLHPYVNQCLVKYAELHRDMDSSIVEKHCRLRFNRYSPGQMMRKHSDHIYDLFDGTQRGIPVLSIVGNLNDDYEGGEFKFWDDHVVKFEKGDIMIFPSLFLYPHRVEPPTRGVRYSFVCWAY